jgi:hypothetical protein
MKVVEFRQDADLQDLAADWNKLLDTSASKTIFLTWEWMAAWWAVYGVQGELRMTRTMSYVELRLSVPKRSGAAVRRSPV